MKPYERRDRFCGLTYSEISQFNEYVNYPRALNGSSALDLQNQITKTIVDNKIFQKIVKYCTTSVKMNLSQMTTIRKWWPAKEKKNVTLVHKSFWSIHGCCCCFRILYALIIIIIFHIFSDRNDCESSEVRHENN